MSLKTTTLSLALGLGLGGLTMTGCDSLIDDVNPRQSVTPDQALETQEGFDAILADAYDALQDVSYYGNNYTLYPDALADNIVQSPSTSNRLPNVVGNVAGSHLNRWAPHYTTINNMNLILSRLEGLDIAAANEQAIKDRIGGEAYFFRALNYFDLARTKGYEPGREVGGFNLSAVLRTEPTETIEDADFRARATNTEVYAQVVSDLRSAIDLLDGAAARPGAGRQFVTVGAAQALLARAQLYAGNWAEAEAAATAALAASPARLVNARTGAALLAAWQASSLQESIFEIQMTPAQDGAATNVNQALQSLTDPRVPNFFDAVATRDLIAAHDSSDSRLGLYASQTLAGTPINFIQKYTGTTQIYVDRIPVFRVPEMLLIQAEARAEQNNVSGAQSVLNTLRNARGLGNTDADDRSELIEAVLQERRLEFAFEGHRFFDLKRRGLDIPKPQLRFDDTEELPVLPYTDYRILAPIPATQVEFNPELRQNPGYGD